MRSSDDAETHEGREEGLLLGMREVPGVSRHSKVEGSGLLQDYPRLQHCLERRKEQHPPPPPPARIQDVYALVSSESGSGLSPESESEDDSGLRQRVRLEWNGRHVAEHGQVMSKRTSRQLARQVDEADRDTADAWEAIRDGSSLGRPFAQRGSGPCVVEVFGRWKIVEEVIRKGGSGRAYDLTNGYDFRSKQVRGDARAEIAGIERDELVLMPPCDQCSQTTKHVRN